MPRHALRLLSAFLMLLCLHLPACGPASFYYRLGVLNSTDEDFIKVTLVQLTDIMKRGHGNPAATQIVARGITEQLVIPGDLDSETTLFLLVAYGCQHDGKQKDVPLKRALVKVLPFSEFRSYTFGSALERVVVEVTDEDLKPVQGIGVMDPF